MKATASGPDAAYVRSLGADDLIDFRAERFEDEANAVDAVVDLVGGETQTRSISVLRPGGVLVSAVSQPDEVLAAQHCVEAMFFLVDVTTACLGRIAEMIDAGELSTDVGAVLPLASARAAHEMLQGSRARPRGESVLRMGA